MASSAVDKPSAPTPAQIIRDAAVSPWVAATAAVASALSLVLRFFAPTSLWLDEALSVNISALPLGEIPDALRHDGHPPLYYWLLHGWMTLFGDGDRAVRSLSGLISLATLPVAYAVGRRIGGARLGWITTLVVAVSPFAFRYGSETRMYAVVMFEVFLGWLIGERLLVDPTIRRWAACTVIAAALLWTHYWSLWLLGAVGIMLIVRLVRVRGEGDDDRRRATLAGLAALVAAGVAFLPWLPNFLYQSQHTGTPWAPPFRPATLVVTSLVDFGGGPFSEAQMLMFAIAVLIFLGIFGVATDASGMALSWSTNPDSRRTVALLVGTTAVASVAGLATGIAFAPRYAAVYFPFVAVLMALGLNRLSPGRARDLTLVGFCVLSLGGTFFVVRQERTQAAVVAEALRAVDDSAFVVVCPDQLGPSVSRALNTSTAEVVTYPRLGDPLRVDWVDYAERNEANDPRAAAADVLARAGTRTIAVVHMDGYLTLEGQCQSLIDTLAESRLPDRLVEAEAQDFYEPMSLTLFTPGAA